MYIAPDARQIGKKNKALKIISLRARFFFPRLSKVLVSSNTPLCFLRFFCSVTSFLCFFLFFALSDSRLYLWFITYTFLSPLPELVAILGPSGAGKTTLLNVLAGRGNGIEQTGSLTFGGFPMDQYVRRRTAYVKQNDLLMGSPTVRETIWYSASLRLPKGTSDDQVNKIVDETLEELGLTGVANSYVGDENVRGVSGGERKRTALGQDLVTDPAVLFLDEYSSGLDSATALSVTRTIRALASKGRTILATVHQPSYPMFELFDNVLLLAPGGHAVYYGPTSEVIEYFEKLGHTIGATENPADKLMDFVQDETIREQLIAEYNKSDAGKAAFEESEKLSKVRNEHASSTGVAGLPSVWKQFKVLTLRNWRNNLRNPIIFGAVIGQVVGFALIMDLVFWRLGYEGDDLWGRASVHVFGLFTLALGLAFGFVAVLPAERPIFNRERANGMYSTGPYFLSHAVASSFITVVSILVWTALIYWPTNLNPEPWRWAWYLLIGTLVGLNGEALGFFIGSISPSAAVGNVLGGTFVFVWLLLAGFFVQPTSIPDWISWFKWTGFTTYGYEAMIKNELEGAVFNCGENLGCYDGLPANTTVSVRGTLVDFTALDIPCEIPSCLYSTGDLYLEEAGFSDFTVPELCLLMTATVVGMRLVSYLALRGIQYGDS